MPETFRNEQQREAHLNQKAGLAVPRVMNTNLLDAGFFASALHLVRQKVFGVGKQPLVGLHAVALCHIGAQAIHQQGSVQYETR